MVSILDTYFKILGSSSSGNAALLRAAGSNILIDAGLSGKKLKFLLAEEGLEIEQLDAVFLTHEHHDHSAGIRGLSRYMNLPIFANRDTIEALQPKLPAVRTGRNLRPVFPSNFRTSKSILSVSHTMPMIRLGFIWNGEREIFSTQVPAWHG